MLKLDDQCMNAEHTAREKAAANSTQTGIMDKTKEDAACSAREKPIIKLTRVGAGNEPNKTAKRLHELGAQKVLVTGTGPLGCVPAELAQSSRNGECSPELQLAAGLFNPQLTEMLLSLNSEIGSNVFIAANTQLTHYDFINNPQAFGFVTSKVACCGQGPYNGICLCTPLSNLCPNRDVYAFWDPLHLSERANRIIVQQILTGSLDYMNPMNLSTILAMDSQT